MLRIVQSAQHGVKRAGQGFSLGQRTAHLAAIAAARHAGALQRGIRDERLALVR